MSTLKQPARGCRCEIIPTDTPRVLTRCRRCKRSTEFYCSENFRMNAQQKTLDVWLIYRCTRCDSTWNREIVSRLHTDALDNELRKQFAANDRETAWRYAFEIDRLRRLTDGVQTGIPYRLELDHSLPEAGLFSLVLACAHPFELRLGKVLAELLGVSRSELERWAEAGRLRFDDPRLTLRSKLTAEVRVAVDRGEPRLPDGR
ncbi:DUF1062 domain-containing protein [Gorillibacterium sp. sgz500922]|uniref:DUF1062 domain-containing protein n=1 Tax=Gorillibacterium sp. sgz500922 TaxID=3446694 RepID=UPI003F67E29E